MEASHILEMYSEYKKVRDLWAPLWQYLGKYIHGVKQDFTETNRPGEFLHATLYDDSGMFSNSKMTAALVGMLWQNGGRSIRMQPPRGVAKTPDVKRYFEQVNEILINSLDDPRAGLTESFEEYLLDQGSFGTSGIGVFEGVESDIMFSPWGVDDCCIGEGPNGKVNKVFKLKEMTAEELEDEYGFDKLPMRVKDAIQNKKYMTKYKVLIAILPRNKRDATQKNNRNMPFASYHIFMDTKDILKESGFDEFPVNWGRFKKKRNESYGRSPGMEALPSILEANALRESVIVATEKLLDPPLGVQHDSMVGNGVVDTSPGGMNVVNVTGQIGSTRNPIFPLFSVGDIRPALSRLEVLGQNIKEHFNIDRLLDFNNQTTMTATEAQMRNVIRGQGLGAIFSRQMNEVLTPTLERAISILFRKKKMGFFENSEEAVAAMQVDLDPIIIPAPIAKLIEEGKDFYEIKYFTPAARIMEAEEATGIQQTWAFAMEVAQAKPEVLDYLDADDSLKKISEISGAPSSVIKADIVVENIRKQRAAQQQQQAQAQQASVGMELAGQAQELEQQGENIGT